MHPLDMNDDLHKVEVTLSENELIFDIVQDWPSGQTVTTYINRNARDDDLEEFLSQLFNTVREHMVTERAPTPLPLR